MKKIKRQMLKMKKKRRRKKESKRNLPLVNNAFGIFGN